VRFEERELQPFSMPVSATELREGSVYFALTYTPEDMTIPLMETLLFVGRDLDPGDVGRVYFQELTFHSPGIRRGVEASNDEADRGWLMEDDLNHIFEYEQALDGIMKCALRRRKLYKQGPMRWEEGELSADAQPISPAELQEGSVYFAIDYIDEIRLTPVMKTLVFIGRDLNVGDTSKFYFQDLYSHADGFHDDSPDKPDWATFHVESENQPIHTFEFEHALEELMRCSVRRRKV
jgi:hypothetical protein